jgi:hypothetical protein
LIIFIASSLNTRYYGKLGKITSMGEYPLILHGDEKDRWYLVFRWLPMGGEQVQILLPDIGLISALRADF